MVSNNKRYCVPARETMRQELLKSTGIKRSIRSIDYYTKELVASGFITRLRRNPFTRGKVKIYQTTLYKLTSKGIKYLYRRALRLMRLAGKSFRHDYSKKIKREKRDRFRAEREEKIVYNELAYRSAMATIKNL